MSAVDEVSSYSRRFGRGIRNSSPQNKKCQRYEVLHRASEWTDGLDGEMAWTVLIWLRIGTAGEL